MWSASSFYIVIGENTPRQPFSGPAATSSRSLMQQQSCSTRLSPDARRGSRLSTDRSNHAPMTVAHMSYRSPPGRTSVHPTYYHQRNPSHVSANSPCSHYHRDGRSGSSLKSRTIPPDFR
eukprot:284815620_4